jgi:hypothetical protein
MASDTTKIEREIYAVLLALTTTPKVDLSLHLSVLDQLMNPVYQHNAKLMQASKAAVTQAVIQDMLFADGSTPRELSSRINRSLSSTLFILSELNQQQKQLLTPVQRVRLYQSLVSGEPLPKTEATQYIKTIERELAMSMELNRNTQIATNGLQVRMQMQHGRTTGKTVDELRRVAAGLDIVVESYYDPRAVRQKLTGGTRLEDSNEANVSQSRRPRR